MAATTPFGVLLEARSAIALDLRADGEEVLVASNASGLMQLARVAIGGGDPQPVTSLAEPVAHGFYLEGSADLLIANDRGGNERHQIRRLAPDGGLADIAVDPELIHTPGAVSADGRVLAYTSNRRNRVDLDVFIRELDTGVEKLVMEGGWNRAVCFSPDRRWLCVVRLGELPMEEHLWLVDVDGGDPVHVAPEQPGRSAHSPSWYPDSQSLLFSTDDGRDTTVVARYSLREGRTQVVVDRGWETTALVADDGAEVVAAINEDGVARLLLLDPGDLGELAELPLPQPGALLGYSWNPAPRLLCRGGRLVVSFTSTGQPADVFCVELRERSLRRITKGASAIPAELAAVPELHRVRSFDGVEVPVFLYRPSRAAATPTPVAFVVHGGPESQFVPSFNAVVLHLVDSGIAVVAPNVRGSTGYGAAYAHLDDGRLRLGSVADLAAIHGWLASVGLDPSRAALTGGSYGGYMTLAGLALHPELWAAGVSIVGISSLVTFLENTSAWRRASREREYGSLRDDRDFLEAASPLTHASRIRAPLLLIHGANDPRVPLSEAEQLHAALRSSGVPCELLVYPDEGHGLTRLANRLDAYPRMAAFLVEHLLAEHRPADQVPAERPIPSTVDAGPR